MGTVHEIYPNSDPWDPRWTQVNARSRKRGTTHLFDSTASYVKPECCQFAAQNTKRPAQMTFQLYPPFSKAQTRSKPSSPVRHEPPLPTMPVFKSLFNVIGAKGPVPVVAVSSHAL
ncbi:hypothetical protein J3458_003472 [Metarhizium acridum]|uniref:uncharacterized protein n=1 Tax=Metarhizium acridum TaxID=92637 RepID=UPI001C6CBFA4|nr:hypothetical protein J3458_003472 [Metarhizium acridum]